MRRIAFVRLAWLLVALLASRAFAQSPATPAAPPRLAFKSHYLVDFATDTVLAASTPEPSTSHSGSRHVSGR